MWHQWKFESALPSLRRFANATISGGTDPITSDRLARRAIKTALAQKLPVADADHLRIALYQNMLELCRNVDSSLAEKITPAFQPLSAIARGLYRLTRDEREVLVLVTIEGFDHVSAAKVLKLPDWVFLARLTRARESLRMEVSRQASHVAPARVSGSHLRVIK